MPRLFLVPVLFAATASIALAAPPKQDAAEKAADPQDKMICKRFVETGSLVKGTRVCKTKREWDKDRADIRTNTSMSGGCNSANTGQC